MTELPSPELIAALGGTEQTIAELLRFFGFRVRNYHSVPVIDAALQSVGLTTDPPFSTCRRTETMKVVPPGPATVTDDDGNDADDSQSDALPHRPFLVSDLPCATATDILRAKSVRSNDTLQKALHMMQREGLSQIPVIDGVSELKGIVTWRSVATMYLRTGIAHELANAMEPAETVEKHMDLFRELPRLNEHGYLLVRDNTGSLTGIITTADITRRFHDTALPYYLLGEIESRLRSCLSRLDANAIGAILKGKNSIAGLMFGDYLKLLHPESDKYAAAVEANWQSLGWRGVDRAMFVNDLRRVKSVRNSIAHFDPTPPTPEDIDHLRKFSSLLKQLM